MKGPRPTSWEDIVRAIGCANYSLLSEQSDYRSTRSMVMVQCPRQHPAYWVTVNHFRSGRRCRACRSTSTEQLRKSLPEGYSLLTESRVLRNSDRVRIRCHEQHEPYVVSVKNLKKARRCPYCAASSRADKRRLSIKDIDSCLRSEGYEILEGLESYRDAHDKLVVLCPKRTHSPYTVSVNAFRNGSRCPGCSAGRASRGETEMLDFVISLGVQAAPTKAMLGKQEIDIYVPTVGLGIEYNGLYWHSESVRPNKNYHLNKLTFASLKGIRLLQFFEDEWRDSRPIVESVIRRALGIPVEMKFQARKCEVRVLKPAERRLFLDANHLQGDCRATISWGLFYRGSLKQVLSLRQVGYTGSKTRHWEIARTATTKDEMVVGGLSKLLSQAVAWLRARGAAELWTFADRRYSQGSSYLRVGFESKGATSPGYWYTDYTTRVHRFGMRKTQDCPAGLTEVQWRQSQGWYRIWDCGQLRFRMAL